MTSQTSKVETGIVLDCARIVAALAVFYYHIGLHLRLPFSDEGDYAVTTFLLLAIVSAVAFSLPKNAALRPGFYLAARLGRLMPLYVCVNIFIYATSFFIPSQLGRPFTAVEFVLSSLGLSQYFGSRYLSTVFWFVPFIIQVYVLIAFGHRFIERLRGWWCVPVAFLLFWVELLAVEAWNLQFATTLLGWTPLCRPAEMLLGVQGGLWLTGRLPGPAFASRIGLYAAMSGVLALGGWQGGEMAYAYTLPFIGLLVTFAILGVAWLFAHVVPAALAGLGRRLGRATYPFYLIHGLAIASIFHRFGRSPGVWLGYLVFCVSAALAIDAVFSLRRRVLIP